MRHHQSFAESMLIRPLCTFLLGLIGFWALGQDTTATRPIGSKKPTLMILPSDNWCVQRFFVTEIDNQGTLVKVPNYKQAFQEDTEIGQVISKIGALMVDRGYPLKDAEQELKNIETQQAEDVMTQSANSAASLAESPLDMLKKRAKADIILQIWWKVNKTETGRAVSFTLEAFDAYTSKRIAASTGTSDASSSVAVPILLESAVVANIDPFMLQLQAHFDDMVVNGREIRLTVKRWDSWEHTLEDEFDGEELTDHINEWMQQHCVQSKFNMTDATENRILFEQVRIPLVDAKQRPMDARQFAKDLQAWLKDPPFGFTVKLMTRGLGEAILVIGEK